MSFKTQSINHSFSVEKEYTAASEMIVWWPSYNLFIDTAAESKWGATTEEKVDSVGEEEGD